MSDVLARPASCGLALAAVACSSSAPESVATTRGAIIDGVISGVEDDAVVALRTPLSGCSGVLVAANLLMTARHCVATESALTFECGLNGELVTGPGGQLGGHLTASTIEVFTGSPYGEVSAARGIEVHSTLTPVICRDDLAFVVLDTELPNSIMPLRTLESTRAGESVRVVGYGAPAGGGVVGQRWRLDDLEVLAVGPDELAPGSFGDAPPRSITLGKGPCYGDSGGPAISAETGAVIGVYSLLNGECASDSAKNYFAQVRPHPDLVRTAFESAGQQIWVEGAAAPGSNAACPGCADDEGGCAVTRVGDGSRTSAAWLLAVASMALAARRRRTMKPAS